MGNLILILKCEHFSERKFHLFARWIWTVCLLAYCIIWNMNLKDHKNELQKEGGDRFIQWIVDPEERCKICILNPESPILAINSEDTGTSDLRVFWLVVCLWFFSVCFSSLCSRYSPSVLPHPTLPGLFGFGLGVGWLQHFSPSRYKEKKNEA